MGYKHVEDFIPLFSHPTTNFLITRDNKIVSLWSYDCVWTAFELYWTTRIVPGRQEPNNVGRWDNNLRPSTAAKNETCLDPHSTDILAPLWSDLHQGLESSIAGLVGAKSSIWAGLAHSKWSITRNLSDCECYTWTAEIGTGHLTSQFSRKKKLKYSTVPVLSRPS